MTIGSLQPKPTWSSTIAENGVCSPTKRRNALPRDKSAIKVQLDKMEAKLQGDMRAHWICRPRSMFLVIPIVMFSLLLLSNVLVDTPSHLHWGWQLSRGMLHSASLNCQASRDKHVCDGDPLPKGIIQQTSDLTLKPLWNSRKAEDNLDAPKNLLAISVGIKQKHYVDRIIQKFPAQNFSIILFHYDGVVDKWNEFSWNKRAIHIVAMNQTKWWFAKRFLHPDIVAQYEYIFIWDEDLGVENFDANRYLEIMEEEGLEIAQPALDPELSDIHHRITSRNKKTRVHRRMYKTRGTGVYCFPDSIDPPCTGWVEGMAPVFTRVAWRCAWRLIQNDLIHGWGMDFKLGYCAQGDRSQHVGVIDSEYIVHRGIPSLGGSKSKVSGHDARSEVRRRSYAELDIFSQRWQKAVKDDKCWKDPYTHGPHYGHYRTAKH